MAQETMDTAAAESSYPVQFSVDYPESSNRLKALFRLILIIPMAVIYILVYGTIGGALFPAVLLMPSIPQEVPPLVVRRERRGTEVLGEGLGLPSPSFATNTPLPTNSKPSNWTSNIPMPKTI